MHQCYDPASVFPSRATSLRSPLAQPGDGTVGGGQQGRVPVIRDSLAIAITTDGTRS